MKIFSPAWENNILLKKECAGTLLSLVKVKLRAKTSTDSSCNPPKLPDEPKGRLHNQKFAFWVASDVDVEK